MQVHEVEGDAALEVAVDAADGCLVADVGDANVRQVRLGDRLVDGLVGADAPQKVRLGLRARHVLVVRVARAHLERDVRRDDRRVVAHRLEEDHEEALLPRDALLDLGPACVAVSDCGRTLETEPTHLRLRVLFVASACARQQQRSHVKKQGARVPWIPTLPPSLSHWISISRLSSASWSRSRVASVLLWLKYSALWFSRRPLLKHGAGGKASVLGQSCTRASCLLLSLLTRARAAQLAYVEDLRGCEE